jgi:hypothetical protein
MAQSAFMRGVFIATRPALCCLLWGCASSPVDKAAAWMAEQPPEAMRFDSAIVLAQIRARHPSATLERAFTRARAVADADADNPHRRLYDPDAGTTRDAVTGWSPEGVTSPNPFVGEALWCDVFGLRPATLRALEGLHDDGGYLSTHALWALELAHQRGCLDGFDAASAALRDELRRTQPTAPGPKTRDVDLFAERLVMLRLAGEGGLDAWTAALRERQNADGSFGSDGTAQQRFHATMMATWALVLK